MFGCGSDASDDRPLGGGTLRFGTTEGLSYGLDPHLEQGAGLAILPKVYGYLLHADPRNDSFVLDHAASIEQPDEISYVVRMAAHRFQQAPPVPERAVTAGDVVRSFERYRASKLVTAKFAHTQIVDSVGAVDDSLMLIANKRPYVYTMAEMCGINAGAILPREIIDGAISVKDGGPGSGPFRVSGRTDEQVSISRFDAYGGEPAFVDGMEWRFFSTPARLAAAFKERAVDIATGLTGADGFAGDDVTIVREPSLATVSLGFRVNKEPFRDARVRKALDYALDRAALVREAGSSDADIAGPVNPHLAGGYWSLPEGEIAAAQGAGLRDEERRREVAALLDAAGAAPLAFTLQVADVPELIDLAALVGETLRTYGIAVTVEQQAQVIWLTNLSRGKFEATLIAQAPHETPDGGLRLYHSRGAEGTGNPFGYTNAAVDALIERSWSEIDREQRRETVRVAQRLMVEDRSIIHLYSGIGFSAVREYVRDSGLELPGSLQRAHYAQWLALPVKDRPN